MKTTDRPRLPPPARETVIGDAERWFARLRAHDTSDTERAQYQTWLEHNQDNPRAAEEVQRVWDLAESLADDPDVLAFADQAEPAVPDLQEAPEPQPAVRRRPMLWPIAGSLAAAAIVSAVLLVRPDLLGLGPARYATDIGEQRRVPLEDGSVMHLNTHTRVAVRYSEQVRLVEVLGGEASFSVQRDASRPFIVRAGNGFVRAVGTRFNVYSTPEQVRVAVLEGAVVVGRDDCVDSTYLPGSAGSAGEAASCVRQPTDIDPLQSVAQLLPIITAGQEVSYSTQRAAPPPLPAPATDLQRVEAWQNGKLEFDSVPLGSAMAEINRYLTRRIVIGDARLADTRVTGVFRIGDPDAVIFALREMLGASADVRNGEIVLRAPVQERKGEERNRSR